jgi:hypothetical protein
MEGKGHLEVDPMGAESTRQSMAAQSEWRRPELRKLPIAATASGVKAVIRGDDGVGQGKGETATSVS